MGLGSLSAERGLASLDLLLGSERSLVMAASLDRGALRELAGADLLPPLFSALISAPRRRKGQGGSLARRLAGVPEPEREALVLAVVREQAAAVLGHPSADAVDPKANFKDLGFDSLGAVELRNRLAEASGVRLDATLVFDYPTPEAVAAYLQGKVQGSAPGLPADDPEEREARRVLNAIPVSRLKESGLLEMLLALSEGGAPSPQPETEESDVDSMDIEDLVRQTLTSSGDS
jgi:acyl carrier protein